MPPNGYIEFGGLTSFLKEHSLTRPILGDIEASPETNYYQ